MSDRIDDLAWLVSSQVQPLICEASDQINEAINAALEEAQEGDGKSTLSLSISVKWDLDSNTVTVSLPVAVKRRFEVIGKLEDKNQVKMNLE